MGEKVISMRDFDAKVQALGSVGAANQWLRDNGYTLPPAGRELPPVREQQGGLEAAAAADEADAAADDEAAAADDAEAGALDLGNLDLSKLRGDPSVFQQLLKANTEANQRADQSAKQLYDEGRKRILEKYAGPSQSERLFALSRAMLSPTKVPGFAGFLGNVTGALSENAKAAREAEQSREEKLFELQQQYQQDAATRAAALPKTAADLAAKYLAATKPTQRRTGFNPVTGRLEYMDTGDPVNEGNLPVLTPQRVAELSRDPRNRGMKFKTTDGRQMEIK